jgi:hypothetical protein
MSGLPDFGTQKVSKSATADFDWMRLLPTLQAIPVDRNPL